MTYKIFPEQDVEAIAEAIRNKNGLSNKYKIGEMAEAINNLGIYSLSGEDNAPYLYRKTPLTSDAELDKIIGGSVVFNQLLEPYDRTAGGITSVFNAETGVIELSGTSTGSYMNNMVNKDVVQGHKFYVKLSAVSNPNNISFTVGFLNVGVKCQVGSAIIQQANETRTTTVGIADYAVGTDFTDVKIKAIGVNLTQMFGSEIADYVYQLEQSTAGAGVAYLKSLGYFTDNYYPYNSGEIKSVSGLDSHDMVGFNQWDEEWELGGLAWASGEKVASIDRIRSKNFCKVVSDTIYYAKSPNNYLAMFWYSSTFEFIQYTTEINKNVTPPTNAEYFKIVLSGGTTTYNNDICINISDTNRNGEYEPYIKHSYPLDNTLTLRGIPKLTDNKIQYDGDVYQSDGSVTRKYAIVDLGSLNYSTTESSGGVSMFISYPTGIKTGVIGEKSIICEKYNAIPTINASIATDTTFPNMSVCQSSGGNSIRIRDDNYTDSTAFKQAMQGVYLIYELAEPTTETAEPYSTIQLCDGAGTEEYVTTGIPVGHETKYLELIEI